MISYITYYTLLVQWLHLLFKILNKMAVHDVAHNLKKKSGMMFSHREAKPGAKAGT